MVRVLYSIRDLTASYLGSLRRQLEAIDLDSIARVGEVLRRARDSRATIFVAGNGGSAATASHWVNDLGKATKRSGRSAMRVMCLCDNTSWFSALANDEGYARAFAGQLENFAQSGDVLIVLSASGNSENLIEAVKLAQARKVTTVGLLGFNGGKLKDIVDDVIWIETSQGEYELVEDMHSMVCHAITRCLINDRQKDS